MTARSELVRTIARRLADANTDGRFLTNDDVRAELEASNLLAGLNERQASKLVGDILGQANHMSYKAPQQ